MSERDDKDATIARLCSENFELRDRVEKLEAELLAVQELTDKYEEQIARLAHALGLSMPRHVANIVRVAIERLAGEDHE